ncbi:MAG: (d)CMP kinase [Chitinispirillaceae bacterium]
MIIAIDGPAGSGKSSTARLVAARLGITLLDTGAMYRAMTLKCLRRGIPAADHAGLSEIVAATDIGFAGDPPEMRIFMDGEDVTAEIRSDEVTKNVSDYCAPLVVRKQMVKQQRKIAAKGSVVCEGRDIGTVVFPNAELKFFMVASVNERARRRQKDFLAAGVIKSEDELVAEISARDAKDSTRENSPLCKAPDAEEINTTAMTLEEQVSYIVKKAASLVQQKALRC